jgi:alkylhydroperoxidase/carboxymuconolactone decarboxylase family protein
MPPGSLSVNQALIVADPSAKSNSSPQKYLQDRNARYRKSGEDCKNGRDMVHIIEWIMRRILVKPSSMLGSKTSRGENMESYYHPVDLGKFAEMAKGNKELWDKFLGYYNAVFAEGALTEREKALIALAVSHAVQCPYCIDSYTQACLEKGSNVEEMTEAVHVACAIRGGSSLVHGIQMRNVAEKLSM